MRCAKCGTKNPSTNNFCAKCGNALVKHCAKCQAENPPTSDFCGKCGTRFTDGPNVAVATSSPQGSAPYIRVTPEQPDGLMALYGERKTVTALFADIKGSTALMEGLDPEAAHAIVEPVLRLMIEAVHRYEGYVVQTAGDGIFALFGAPVAHEDHPQRALYAALRIQEELKRYATKLREAGELPIEARVGVNTGEVVAYSVETDGKVEYRLVGHTANLASRMEALAPTGSIAISEDTRRLVEGYFQLKPLGPTRVKGVREPVNVYEVTGLGPLRTRLQRSAGRGLTKFVGREHEMEALWHAAEQANAGRGQIVAAMAEPGTGKSRLFYEFKVKNQSGWMMLETFPVSHGKASSYLPVLDLLQGYFKITGEDDPRARRAKVAGNVLTLDRSLEDTLPYVFSLLGIVDGEDPLASMNGQSKKRRTLEAIKRILLRESLNQPLMMIIEDLQWIDEATQELLNLVTDSIGTAKILLLVNYRPGYSHQWSNKTYYTQLRLDPLGQESAEELLFALLGEGVAVAPLKRMIIEQTEGNPFFMEETVHMLLDEGTLVRDGAAVKLTKSLDALKIPPTVQGILAARIDRLPPNAKDLLQTLAVIGRDFSLSLIRAVVTKPDDELSDLLNDVQMGEFIYEQPAVGDTEYVFKHALVRDAAYASLLLTTRSQLHRRIADTLKAQFPKTAALEPEFLAHHYTEGGRALEAIEYWFRAGRLASERSANQDAVGHLRIGLGLCETLPESTERARQELALQQALSGPLMATTGWGSEESVRTYARARELCVLLGETEQLSPVFHGQWINNLMAGELQVARELATQLLSLAQQHEDTTAIMYGHRMLGWTALLLGEFAKVCPNVDKALALYVPEKHSQLRFRYVHDGRVAGYCALVCYQWLTGSPQQAIATGEAAITYARHLKHANSLAFALFQFALLSAMERDALAAELRTKELIALSHEQGFQLHEIWGRAIAGWAIGKLGRRAQGVAQLRQAIQGLIKSGQRVYVPLYLGLLAELQIEDGEVDGALQALKEAEDLIELTHEKWWQPDLHRLRGEALLGKRPGALKDAEIQFRQAFDLAQAAGSKSLQLRAATRLAKLLYELAQYADARTLLEASYRQFGEGFDTVDRLEAQTLLRSIS